MSDQTHALLVLQIPNPNPNMMHKLQHMNLNSS